MLHIQQVIVVEGKYDKIKLSSIVDAIIIPTHGFRIFKDRELLELIRGYARTRGIVILTDSDRAGFAIRNFLKGAIHEGQVLHVYIPDVLGKERRKEKPSAEGKLGVEGMTVDTLRECFSRLGIIQSEVLDGDPITKTDLFMCGLSGTSNSSEKRRQLQRELHLPEVMSTPTLLATLNTMMTREEFLQKMEGRLV